MKIRIGYWWDSFWRAITFKSYDIAYDSSEKRIQKEEYDEAPDNFKKKPFLYVRELRNRLHHLKTQYESLNFKCAKAMSERDFWESKYRKSEKDILELEDKIERVTKIHKEVKSEYRLKTPIDFEDRPVKKDYH